MVNIISDYIPPFSPLPNIAPFTYKDGETYLTMFDSMRTFVNTTLVQFVNDNFALLNDSTVTEINALITQVNTELVGVASDVTQVQTIHDQVVGLVASLPDLTTTLANINGGVAAANASAASAATDATTASNNATNASVSAANASNAATTVVNTQKGSDYGIAGLDSAAKLLEVNIPARLSDGNLSTEFALKSVEAIVTSGRLSDTALNAEFIPFTAGNVVGHYNTQALLPTSGMSIDMIVFVNNIPGAYFRYTGPTTYRMEGVAKFIDASTRDMTIIYPAIGMLARVDTEMFTRQYNGSTWVPYGSNVFIIKPTVSGTGTSVNDNGLIVLTNSPTFSISGLTGFRKIIVDVVIDSTSVSNNLFARLRNGVTDDLSSNYDWIVGSFNGTVASALNSPAASSWIGITFNGTIYSMHFELENIDKTMVTHGNYSGNTFSSTAVPQKIIAAISHRLSSVFDGMTFTASSGSVTGSIRVTGQL